MQNELVEAIQKSGIDEEMKIKIMSQFEEFHLIAEEMDKKAKSLVVTNDSQTDIMREARDLRLFLVKKRGNINDTRVRLKEKSKIEGNAIQLIANSLTNIIKALEVHLYEQENFVEIREDLRKDKLLNERHPILSELGVDCSLYNLREMPDEDFDLLVNSTKERIRLKKEEEERAEQQRITDEKNRDKERIRLKKQNEKLKAEAKKHDDEIAAEQEKTRKANQAKRVVITKYKNVELKEVRLCNNVKVKSPEQMLIIARKALTDIIKIANNGCRQSCKSCINLTSVAITARREMDGTLKNK